MVLQMDLGVLEDIAVVQEVDPGEDHPHIGDLQVALILDMTLDQVGQVDHHPI